MSANFGNSFVAIFIQMLKSLLLRPKLNHVSCGLYSIKGDKLVNGSRQLRGHRFGIVTVHFTNSRALSFAGLFIDGRLLGFIGALPGLFNGRRKPKLSALP